jgi:hypothetical protein
MLSDCAAIYNNYIGETHYRAGPDIFVARFGTKMEADIPLYFFTIGLLSAICNL